MGRNNDLSDDGEGSQDLSPTSKDDLMADHEKEFVVNQAVPSLSVKDGQEFGDSMLNELDLQSVGKSNGDETIRLSQDGCSNSVQPPSGVCPDLEDREDSDPDDDGADSFHDEVYKDGPPLNDNQLNHVHAVIKRIKGKKKRKSINDILGLSKVIMHNQKGEGKRINVWF